VSMPRRPFVKGDRVRILPEFQDEGDDDFVWVVVGDEEKGRVDISPINTGMNIVPTHTVRAEWLAVEPTLTYLRR
jgi:hypothetical protein